MSQHKADMESPGADLLSLVEGQDGELVSVVELTRLRESGNIRASYKLELADGRTFKGRQFATVEARDIATTLLDKTRGLPFSTVIASAGIATLEEWIVGTSVDPEDVRHERIAESASVLGRLHALGNYPRESPFVPDWKSVSLDRVERDFDRLVEVGMLRRAVQRSLLGLADENEPEELETGVIHRDFHPGNMVVTDDGMLYIVDNERMSIGALDFDLARSWSRWPMNDSQRGIFCSSYEEHRSLDKFIEHGHFWAILSLARTARIHAWYNKVNQLALDQLCEISRTNGMVTWPVAAREPTL